MLILLRIKNKIKNKILNSLFSLFRTHVYYCIELDALLDKYDAQRKNAYIDANIIKYRGRDIDEWRRTEGPKIDKYQEIEKEIYRARDSEVQRHKKWYKSMKGIVVK